MSPRILLVDDHPALRRGVGGIIIAHALGSVVGEAENGKEAIEKAKELSPDLIVMDISMPIMGGLEATKEIRKFAPSRLKILILTTHAAQQMTALALEAGADLVVEKAAAQPELVKAILTLCKPSLANRQLEEMTAAREDWLREAGAHETAFGTFQDTEGNPDGAEGLRIAASRETVALKKYRAAVQAWAASWRGTKLKPEESV